MIRSMGRWLFGLAAGWIWLNQAHAAQNGSAPGEWPSFLGNDAATSYSPLEQIDRHNVRQLAPVWMYALGGPQQNSAPVVVDGTMYVVTAEDRVIAFDAVTGAVKWTHEPSVPPLPNRIFRGSAAVATGFGLVFYGMGNNHLVALDAATGREVWDVEIESRDQCSCQPSHGLLLVKDKIVVGVRGDVAHRGYINAFDARTGRQAWRWWTVPAPGEPGHESWNGELWKFGGGASWYAGSYDPKLNLIYWGIANPQPIMGGMDPGDKKWTNSLVALDADSGELRWGFQEAPGDQFDYDSASEAMLVDEPVNGKMTPLVVHAVKSGYTYVLNRATGALVAAYPHAAAITWNKGLTAAGRPIDPVRMTKEQAVTVCPSYYGSRAANHGAYSPRTGLWYGSSAEICSRHRAIDPPKLVEGRSYNASKEEGMLRSPDSKPLIAAFDPATGKRRWTIETEVPNVSSLLVTGGGLLFGSSVFGELWARDAETGERLWSFRLGAQNANPAVTYAIGGQQYLAVVTGGGGAFPMRIKELWPEEGKRMAPMASTLIVMALPVESAPAGAGQ
jgi:alcohol dehydrogenase (cytochrome c)